MFEIGNSLREARMRKGLDILDCEAGTKIRAKYLRAMEEEQFDLMPSPTYVRGFLRTYGEYLDLDGQLIIDEYESRFGSLSELGEPDLARRRARPQRRPRRRRSEAQLLWLAIGGVLAVALLVWLGIGEDDGPDAVVSTAPPAAAPATQPVPEPAPDATPVEAPERVAIVLTGTGAEGSYLQVRGRNQNGKLVYDGLLPSGDRLVYRVKQGIYISAGNTDGLAVTVAGEPVAIEGGTAQYLITRSEARRLG